MVEQRLLDSDGLVFDPISVHKWVWKTILAFLRVRCPASSAQMEMSLIEKMCGFNRMMEKKLLKCAL